MELESYINISISLQSHHMVQLYNTPRENIGPTLTDWDNILVLTTQRLILLTTCASVTVTTFQTQRNLTVMFCTEELRGSHIPIQVGAQHTG